jgi:hypothetical protein
VLVIVKFTEVQRTEWYASSTPLGFAVTVAENSRFGR